MVAREEFNRLSGNREKILSYLGLISNATVSEIARGINLDYQTVRKEIDQLKTEKIICEDIEKEITLVYSVVR